MVSCWHGFLPGNLVNQFPSWGFVNFRQLKKFLQAELATGYCHTLSEKALYCFIVALFFITSQRRNGCTFFHAIALFKIPSPKRDRYSPSFSRKSDRSLPKSDWELPGKGATTGGCPYEICGFDVA
jgi:hypothetical protein